jgi:cytochrome P450
MPDHPSTRPDTETGGGLGDVFRPLDGEQLEDPYPFYARARDEQPVFFSRSLDAWVVTRYDDVRAILQQPETFSSRDTLRPVVEFTPQTVEVLGTGYGFRPVITNTDGAAHRRFRVPLQHAFRPGRMRTIEGAIRAAAGRLLDDLAPRGEMDLVADFAAPLSLRAILQLCDVPEGDVEFVVRWFQDAKALTMSALEPERQVACARSFVAAQRYVAGLVDRRRAAPDDDLIGNLLGVHSDESAPLDTAEIVNTTIGTMLAGHDTTASLIVNAMLILLSQPQRWAAVREQPETIPGNLEEALRIDSPVPLFIRTAMHDATVGAVVIPQGAILLLAYGSANRDPARFSSPESFDPSRSPNPHLAFGHGVHACVGAPLARLVGRIALQALTRLPGLRLRPGQPLRHLPTLQFRALARLAVEWNTPL